MPRDEPPDAQFERVKKKLQNSILNNYPNPERTGCPGDAVLKELAGRPLEDNLEGDPHWHHVTHCSECYREFLGFRAEMRRRARSRRARVALAVAAAVIVCLAGVFFVLRKPVSPKRPQNAELVFRTRIVDLEGRAVSRSEEGRGETKPILLQREPEELSIRLPFGSRAGHYEVQIVRSAGHPLLSAAGEAGIENGTTTLVTRMDLSRFEPGSYFICVRRVPWDWTCYPVLIR